jgi:hypothetical protein
MQRMQPAPPPAPPRPEPQQIIIEIQDRTEWQNEKAAMRESGAMQVHFQRTARDQIKAAEGDAE